MEEDDEEMEDDEEKEKVTWPNMKLLNFHTL